MENHNNFGYLRRHSYFAALFAYLLGSILLTWPLAIHLDSVLFGDYGDARGGVWWVWAKANGLLEASISSLTAAPFGAPSSQAFSQPVAEWLPVIIAKFSNEVAASNIFILLAFPLTAIATFFLLDRLLHNKSAAFFGGLVFGFCPAAVMQVACGHTSFAFNLFIPLFLLALFYNRSQRTLLSALYVGTSFALITFTALYFGYFSIYIALYFFAFDLLTKKNGDLRDVCRNYLYCAVIAIVLIVPIEYRAIFQQITLGNDVLAKAGHARDFGELITYSSRPWEFVIPSIDHPYLGNLYSEYSRSHLHGSNIPEQTLYLGLVPISLMLTGIGLAVRRKFDVEHRILFKFFAFGALWMYFLSLPPLLAIGSIKVPTLSYFAYYVAPMFRVYARFGILVDFFVACAAAVVLAHLYQHMKHTRYYVLLAVSLIVLIFEYWSVPPNFALAVDRPPEVYQWLAKEPGDVIVAEYPMTTNDEFAFYTYLFWQRIHKKKLVNGAARDNAAAWAFFEKVKNLDDPQTPALLKSAGANYIIVHKKMYQEGLIPEPIKRYFTATVSGMNYNGGKVPSIPHTAKFYKAFGTDMVFSLEKVPTKSVPKTAYLPTERPS